MPDVDDILTMNSTESRCSINGDTRDIVVPDEYHIFGVESDENVTRIPFICPKIVGDNVDLTGYSLYINYINGAGLGGIYVVDDVVTSGDNITFSWLLSRNVTAKAGKVSYIICAKKSGTDTKVTNEWNTKIATGTVSSGIETHDTVVQQSSDVINKLLKLTQGESAYDIAIDNGFVGTKAEWLESLKGEEGTPGKDGTNGKDGTDGAPGAAGAPGKDGTNGHQVRQDNDNQRRRVGYRHGRGWRRWCAGKRRR